MERENEGGALDDDPQWFLLLYACSTISIKRENRGSVNRLCQAQKFKLLLRKEPMKFGLQTTL